MDPFIKSGCCRYSVPRIAYINKLDKPAASIANTVRSIQRKLSSEPLLTQIPLGGEGKHFFGIVDLGETSAAISFSL